jgi:glycosyltransferase involved in cell wall biosynthesis
MNNYKPFISTPFFLDRESSWKNEIHKERGYYVVVWWENLPLGDFFIHAGENLNQHHFEQRLVHAITPAIRHYNKTENILLNTIPNCIEVCKKLFTVNQSLPERCDVSLVICTKDRSESLEKCLKSILNLPCAPAEIIIVDNASKDTSTKNIVELLPGLIYVRENRPGLDIARNTGARKATYPIIVYTDDDTEVHPHWIYEVFRTFDDPMVKAMTGLVIAKELNTEAQWIFEKFWPFNRGYADKRFDQIFFQKSLSKGPPVWNIGAGANMAFRKSVFTETGYFDERLDVGAAGCNGDSEMWYRILAGGGAIHYNPRAVVFHLHRESLAKLQSQIFSYMRGFTAACLIQYQRFNHAGNLKHLFLALPKYYGFLIARGFPRYRGRFTTIFSEMKGMFSGLIFYLKNRNTPSNIK